MIFISFPSSLKTEVPPRMINMMDTQNTAPEPSSNDPNAPYRTEGGRGK